MWTFSQNKLCVISSIFLIYLLSCVRDIHAKESEIKYNKVRTNVSAEEANALLKVSSKTVKNKQSR